MFRSVTLFSDAVMTIVVQTESAFDIRRATRTVRVNVAMAFLTTAAATALVMALVARVDWWRGWTAATVAGLLAAGASLIPLVIGLRNGYSGLMSGFLAAIAVRMLVSIGAVLIAILAGHYPAVPTIAMLVPYYLGTLAVEAWTLSRGLPAES